VEEWLPRAKKWRPLDLGGVISDPCLVRPLSVKALLDAAAAKDEVARALEAQDNPAILAMKAASAASGEERAQRRAAAAVLTVLASRGLDAPPRVRAAVEGSKDLDQLFRWLERAATAASAEEAIDEG
jgi:hypothetical protein